MLILDISGFWSIAVLFLFLTFLQCQSVKHLKIIGVETVGITKVAWTTMAARGGGGRHDVGHIFVPRMQTGLSRSCTGKAGPPAATFLAAGAPYRTYKTCKP